MQCKCLLLGTKRTSLVAPHMSALGGKADMNFFGNSLSVGRYRGQSGHDFVHRICLLLTQSGHGTKTIR